MKKASVIEASAMPGAAAAVPSAMKTRHFLGDAMGMVSMNIITNLVGMIMFFYTDVIGIAVETVGMVMFTAKLIDAFADIGMGFIVDRTKSKHGVARPWLMRMAAPALAIITLMFAIPSGTSANIKIAYILITNILLTAVVHTSISVPYSSLMSLGTKNPLERSKMSVWRTAFAYASSSLVNILLIPATNGLGGGQRAWVIMGVFLGAVSMGTLIAAFFSTRERNVIPSVTESKPSLGQGLGLLFKNKYWVILLSVNILISLTYALAYGTFVYYAKHIFGDENLVATLGLSDLLFAFLSFILAGSVIKKTGNRNAVIWGMAIAISGCVMRLFNPYSIIFGAIGKGLTTMGTVSVIISSNAMMADVIEYGEWKTGKRMVGLPSSVSSFGGQLGSSLWVGAVGLLLAWSGYNGMLSEQPVMATKMIIMLNIHMPLVCFALILILMLFYKLDKDYGWIVTELEARRNKKSRG